MLTVKTETGYVSQREGELCSLSSRKVYLTVTWLRRTRLLQHKNNQISWGWFLKSSNHLFSILDALKSFKVYKMKLALNLKLLFLCLCFLFVGYDTNVGLIINEQFSFLSVGDAVANICKNVTLCLHSIPVRIGSRQDEGILLELNTF